MLITDVIENIGLAFKTIRKEKIENWVYKVSISK
jgi:hypothetical protein